ncbi:hypothetical protein LSH36_405g02062 [Paralvinella palmiformis]|uniref:EF-hand domain-containing protein n=1 Tax=Paralvinella palmiformis TaxID=53620 RepID=A0AAD9JCU1_9ANNE|nr:hypothetical protein LSH36_405g02062 [Paralvinella palmiformis]
MALSEEENHKFRAVFDQFDANGDGVLSYDELRSALLNVGYEMREQDFQSGKNEEIIPCNGHRWFWIHHIKRSKDAGKGIRRRDTE